MNGGGYTLRRLRISERTVFLWHVLSCFFCFVILWMAEILVLTALCRYFLTQEITSGLSNQALFLAFYRNAFLHSILPLESVSRWIYLFCTFASLAFVTIDMQTTNTLDYSYIPWSLDTNAMDYQNGKLAFAYEGYNRETGLRDAVGYEQFWAKYQCSLQNIRKDNYTSSELVHLLFNHPLEVAWQ